MSHYWSREMRLSLGGDNDNFRDVKNKPLDRISMEISTFPLHPLLHVFLSDFFFLLCRVYPHLLTVTVLNL